MKVGTKSLLFGAHQFLLHPACVAVAWRRLYGRWPGPVELFCIAVHDLGYWGCETMDGDDGVHHPRFGAEIARAWFGNEAYKLCVGHSRGYSRKVNIPLSMLCAADKLGTALVPDWLYLAMVRLTGEHVEYMADWNWPPSDDAGWVKAMQTGMRLSAGRIMGYVGGYQDKLRAS